MSERADLDRMGIRQGKPGRDGRDGRDGLPGAEGAPGPMGPRGFMGPQGERGLSGKDGAPGRDGVDGKDGAPGVKGDTGARGAPGRDGIDGKDGLIGPMGPRGVPGPQGEQGPQGERGEVGPMPDHQWDGTRLRFEFEDSMGRTQWGEFVDLQGPRGPAGRSAVGGGATSDAHGIPSGGSTGQVLKKTSSSDYAVQWANESGGGGGGGGGLTGLEQREIVFGASDGSAAQNAHLAFGDSIYGGGIFLLSTPNYISLAAAADVPDAGLSIITPPHDASSAANSIFIQPGSGNPGGNLRLTGGTGAGNQNGGHVIIAGGAADGSGAAGDVQINPGQNDDGHIAHVKIGTQVSYGDAGQDDGTLKLTLPNWVQLDAAADTDAYGLYLYTGDKTGDVQSSNLGLWTGSVDGAGPSGSFTLNTGNATGAGNSGLIAINTGSGGDGGSGGITLYSGYGSGGNTGSVSLLSGPVLSGSGASGSASLITGNNNATGISGEVLVASGTAAASTSGNVTVQTGNVASVGNVGTLTIKGGNNSGSGNGGNIELTPGTAMSGLPGKIILSGKVEGRLLEKIASGTVSSPVDYVDVSLPTGYEGFTLALFNFKCDSDWVFDHLAFALSEDGGATWHNTSGDYQKLAAGVQYNSVGDPNLANVQQLNRMICIPSEAFVGSQDGFTMRIDLRIDPGSASRGAIIYTDGASYAPLDPDPFFAIGQSMFRLNTGSARVNKIRLLPDGNDDVDPPTSGATLTAGAWILYGHVVS